MTIRINSQTVINGKTIMGTSQGNTVLWDASSLTVDLVGNTITNNAVTTSTSIYTIGTQSAAIDAYNDRLVWPTSTAPGTQDFFYGVWARWTRYGSGDSCMIAGFGNGYDANTLLVAVRNPSYSAAGVFLAKAADYTSYTTNYIPTENVWHHVAVSRSGNTYRIFVDGTLRGTHTIAGLNITAPFRVGSGWSTGEYLNGYINSAQLVIGRPVVTSNFTITSPSYIVT